MKPLPLSYLILLKPQPLITGFTDTIIPTRLNLKLLTLHYLPTSWDMCKIMNTIFLKRMQLLKSKIYERLYVHT